MKDFTKKYGIKDLDENPTARRQDEITAVEDDKGRRRRRTSWTWARVTPLATSISGPLQGPDLERHTRGHQGRQR